MRVCSMCGKPENVAGVCGNCGSRAFKMIGNNMPNYQNVQPNGYQPTYQQPSQNYQPRPNYYNPQPVQNVRYVQPAPNGRAATVAQTVIAAKTGASVAKIVIPIVLVLVLVISAAIAIPMFLKDANGPEKTVASFVESYNNQDMKGMIECFDKKTQNAYNGLMGLSDDILGFGVSNLIDMAGVAGDIMGVDFPTLQMEVIDTRDVSSTECYVTVNMTTTIDGESMSDTDEIHMVKEDGKWYFDGDELISELF